MMRSLIVLLSLAAINLPAQYTAQFQPPPLDQPGLTGTDAYALNNMGQVFGRAINSNGTSRAPVLWAGGVGRTLPVPAGYVWGDIAGVHFINDLGLIVSTVETPQGYVYPVLWLNGAILSVINVLPSPNCQGYPIPLQPGANPSMYPIGLNKAGDVLVATCGTFFVWNGGFQYAIPQSAPITGCVGLEYTYSFSGNHLNDADHAALDRMWFVNAGGCPIKAPEPVLYRPAASFTFVPIVGTSSQINNRDQILVGQDPSHLQLWDGVQVHDLGPGGYPSLNNAGQVAFMAGSASNLTPSLYENGAVTPLVLPPAAKGIYSAGLNDAGQIAGTVPGLPDRAVLLTPAGACAADVTSQVSITLGGFRYNHSTGHFTQTVTVTNTSGSSIVGPISLALDNVPANATLFGINGATLCDPPQGSPYVNLAAGALDPGTPVSGTVEFIDTANTGIAYNVRVMAGTAGR